MRETKDIVGGYVALSYIATNGLFPFCYIFPSRFGLYSVTSQYVSSQSISPSEPRLINSRYPFKAWNWCANFLFTKISEKFHVPIGFAFVIAVILAATFGSPQTPDNSYKNRGISIAGLVIFYLLLYATSANRKKIVWRTVLVGLLCQFLLALFVLRTGVGYDIFNFISFLARYLFLE
jgi:hypothetical protein